jgi:hypothetical protein
MTKVSQELAEQEVESFLTRLKTFEADREKFKEQQGTLIEAIKEGVLTYQKDGEESFTQTLMFPMGEGESAITELKYRSRISDHDVRPWSKGVSNNDFLGHTNALVAALTKTNRAIIEKLNSADKRIASAIAVFFM